MRDLSSLARDQTGIPCIARWILNHWTTREVPAKTSNGTCQTALLLLRDFLWLLSAYRVNFKVPAGICGPPRLVPLLRLHLSSIILYFQSLCFNQVELPTIPYTCPSWLKSFSSFKASLNHLLQKTFLGLLSVLLTYYFVLYLNNNNNQCLLNTNMQGTVLCYLI